VGPNTEVELMDHFANERLNVRLGIFNSGFSAGDFETTPGQGIDNQWDATGRLTSPVYYADGGH